MRFKVGSYFMVLISTLVLMAGCASSPDEKTATDKSTTASSDEVRTFTHPLGTLELI
ncbi:hypothetical protein [Paenibacillus sp. TC-CSREp1]|uniref:hypothetical protein n=1 Tax=Paenibacillus sp. TC-CSREp1 TaxID=3410089 RepID=UPI003CFBA741